jgi:type II secretory pathway pseudopilin PulG
MTFTEVVVSAVILGISSQVSLQGWSRTSQSSITSARTDHQVRLLEQRLLASRRALASAPVVDADCRWDPEAVVDVLEGLPKDADLSSSWRFEPSGSGLWLVVELTNPAAVIPFRRSQLFTPAGLGHCPREVSDEL